MFMPHAFLLIMLMIDATCPEDGLAGICAETCFGEVSCDYWIEFSDSFS